MSEDRRIREIRAVLTEYVSTSDLDAQLDVRRRIRAIVDREPPAPDTDAATEVAVSLDRAPDGASEVGESHFRAMSVEADTERGLWYLHVLDEPVHHTTEGVPVNVDWTRDGTLIGVELLGPGNLKSAPRVFFPGDMVPEDTLTINKRGYWGIVALKYTTEHVCVEVAKPSPEEWQAAVDRARDARANAEWQHTEGVTP